MTTLDVLRKLWSLWHTETHPIYLAECREAPPGSLFERLLHGLWARLARSERSVVAVLIVMIAVILAQLTCGGIAMPTLLPMFWLPVVGVFVTLLTGMSQFWLAMIAIRVSRVIVRERERAAWDSLLTMPLDWSDMVLAKLAAATRPYVAFGRVILWSQLFLIVLAFFIGFDQFRHDARLLPYGLPVLIVAALTLCALRLQDCVLVCLESLVVSLLAPSRPIAAIVALLAAIIIGLVQALLTVSIALIPGVPTTAPFLVLIATGPASVLLLWLPPLTAAAVCLGLICVREVLIRMGYKWLIVHLGDPGGKPRNGT